MNALVERAALEWGQTAPSPLARARVQRQLTVDEAARRASLTRDEIGWIEEGRLYRFGPTDKATQALLLYATALGVTREEALRLAGLPVTSPNRKNRFALLAVVGATLFALAVTVSLPRLAGGSEDTITPVEAAQLPPPWKISVDVLNGGGDIAYTRRVADRIGSMAYQIKRVARANRFDYPETAVYFPPGAEGIGRRLATQLGVEARPLPGGQNRRRLVVIAGPARGLN
jgi:transcriptional regulator with XRE-family HTH domain